MDILAHALWVVLALELARRHAYLPGYTAEATMVMGLAPDMLQTLPLFGWILFGGGSFSAFSAYSLISPAAQSAMPAALATLSQHLHAFTHSAVVALVVTMIIAAATKRLWFPLLGWWLHIVIDAFSHAPDYSAPVVLYSLAAPRLDVPVSESWFIVLNFAALLAASIALYLTREQRESWNDGE